MKITYYISMLMIALAMFLGGCDERKDVERKDLSFLGMNQNEVFDPEEYPYLNAFTGNMTGNNLLTILDTCMKILNESQRLGHTSSADYQALLNIMTHLRDTMAQEMSAEALDTTLVADISALLSIMAGEDPLYPDCQIGATLDQLVQKVGPDVLSNEVTAMLTYIMAADTQTVKDAVSGLSIADIKDNQEAFETLLAEVNGILDPRTDGRYYPLYKGLIDYDGDDGIIDQLGLVSGSEITLGELKTVLKSIKDINFSSSEFLTAETETAVDDALDALGLIIDGQASSLKQADVENIMYLLYKLVHWWNGDDDSGVDIDPDVIRDTITEVIDLLADDAEARLELAGVLYSVAQLLNSDDMPTILSELGNALNEDGLSTDKTLQTLLDEVLHQLPATSDASRLLPDEIMDIMVNLSADTSQYARVDEGLNDYFIQRDEYGEWRTTSHGESAFLSLLKAIKNADTVAPMDMVATILFVDVPISVAHALDLVNPDGTYDLDTSYIAEFLVGEIVRAIRYRYHPEEGGAPYPAADYNGDHTVDPNEAMYWLLWEKHYEVSYTMIITFTADYYGVLDFSFMQLQDLTDLVSNPDAATYALDLAPPEYNDASTIYEGRIRDFIPALAALSGWAYTVPPGTHVTAITPAQDPSTTPQHSLIALMWPLMDYFWSNGQTSKLVDLLGNILDYSTLATDGNGTSYAVSATTAHALQDLEGIYGTGVIPLALRTHGTNDDGLLDNALPLIAKIVNQLNDSGVLSRLTSELDAQETSWVGSDGNTTDDMDIRFIQKLEYKLFDEVKPGETYTLIEKTRLLLTDNADSLADVCIAIGDLMTKDDALDPLLEYAVSPSFFTNLQTIWDSGNTWDKLDADIDDIKLQLQTITGDSAPDIMDELETALYDLSDLDNPPADIGDKPLTALVRYLLVQNGSSIYNPFVDSFLSVMCKTLDYYDVQYNPVAAGSLTGISANTTVVKAVKNITEAYDLQPVQNLLVALTEKQTAEGDLLLYKLLSDLSTFSEEAFGDDELPLSIVQALFRELEVRGTPTSAVAVVMDQIYPGMVLVHSGGLSFQDVIGDANRLFGGLDMQPNGEVYTTLFQALDFVVQNVRVQQ